MTYTDTVALLSAQAEERLIACVNQFWAGTLGYYEMLDLATAILIQARQAAVGLADAAVATELTRLWGRYIAPLGLSPYGTDDDEQVADEVEDLARSDEFDLDTAAAIGVMARAVVHQAAQETYQITLRLHGVKSWTRETNSGACEVCTNLADGTEVPIGTDMWSHKGCGCTPRPTE